MIRVLGIGPSESHFMTKRVLDKIKNSDIIIGGKRNIDMVLGEMDISGKDIYYISKDLDHMKSYIDDNIDKDICILASGDPLVYGIGSYILRNFERESLDLEPGISSIQYAFSRFGLDMNDLYITSCHGRDLDMEFLLVHDKVAMVTDRKYGPIELARDLYNMQENYMMYIGNRLGYKDEVLIEAGPQLVKNIDVEFDLAVVILMRKAGKI